MLSGISTYAGIGTGRCFAIAADVGNNARKPRVRETPPHLEPTGDRPVLFLVALHLDRHRPEFGRSSTRIKSARLLTGRSELPEFGVLGVEAGTMPWMKMIPVSSCQTAD
jgi:hypothetical protein